MSFEKNIGAVILAAVLAAQVASQVTLHVPGSYPTIQQAVDAAVDGDTVAVGPGVYTDTVAIQKYISVIGTHGADMTHISRPNHVGPVVFITALNGPPLFRGFTVRDATLRALSATGWAFIEDCIIRDNVGVGAIGTSPAYGPVTFARCVIRNNQGRHGLPSTPPNFCFNNSGSPAALSLGGYAPTVFVDCVFMNNTGGDASPSFCSPIADGGAGVYGGGGQVVMINCTVTGNVGGRRSPQPGSLDGAGVFDIDGNGPIVHNCIIKGNSGLTFDTRDRATPIPPIIPVPGPIEVRNSNVDSFATSHPPFPFDIAINNIDADPQFVDPMNGDYRLLPTSPCIDTGDAALAISDTDFEGNPRVVGANVDMGWDEFVPVLAGTGEGLELLTGIDGLLADLDARFARGGSSLTVEIVDDSATFGGAVPVLVGQVFLNGAPPTGIPTFPLWIDPLHIALFHDGHTDPGPSIGAMPITFGPVVLPMGLGGLVLRLQSFGFTSVATNGIYAATKARDLWFD